MSPKLCAGQASPRCARPGDRLPLLPTCSQLVGLGGPGKRLDSRPGGPEAAPPPKASVLRTFPALGSARAWFSSSRQLPFLLLLTPLSQVPSPLHKRSGSHLCCNSRIISPTGPLLCPSLPSSCGRELTPPFVLGSRRRARPAGSAGSLSLLWALGPSHGAASAAFPVPRSPHIIARKWSVWSRPSGGRGRVCLPHSSVRVGRAWTSADVFEVTWETGSGSQCLRV